MTYADNVKIEIDNVLFDISEAVNLMAQVEQKIESVSGSVVLLGMLSPNNGLDAAFGLNDAIGLAKDDILKYLFELRQTVTVYRNKL